MIHLHHSTAFKNHLIDKKKSANNNNNNGSPIKTLKDALACSRLRESRVREMHEEKREETATGPLSKITRSYFRVPFTYASSLLRESLQQNKDARQNVTDSIEVLFARDFNNWHHSSKLYNLVERETFLFLVDHYNNRQRNKLYYFLKRHYIFSLGVNALFEKTNKLEVLLPWIFI